MRLPISCVLAALLLSGCQELRQGRSSDRNGGTLIIAAVSEPDYLNPILTNSQAGYEVVDQIFDRLAVMRDSIHTFGDQGFVPQLADGWSWAPDSLSIAFHIDPRARWHDGAPVRAADVAFTYAATVDPAAGSPMASLLGNIASVTARDSATAVFTFKHRSPEQFYDAVYQLRILPEHLYHGIRAADWKTAAVTRAPVGSGRFRFVRWLPGQRLELIADTANWRGRPRLDRVVWSFTPDPAAAVTRLFAGQADMDELLPPDAVPQLAAHPELTTLVYPSLDYGYLLFDLRDPANPARPHPLLGDRSLRRALTMAVDREALVRNVFDTLARTIRCPCPSVHGIADSSVRTIPYDLAGAKRLLDSLGWHEAGGSGVRERNGTSLRFSILVPAASATRQRMAVPLQAMLRQAGVDAQIEPLEGNLFIQRVTSHHFDAAMITWHADPTPSTLRQGWSAAAARDREGANFGGYIDPAFDAILDSAVSTTSADAASRLYREAYDVLNADAPAIWLFEQRNVAAMDSRIHTVGGHTDSWWAQLGDWWIAPDERIARDRLGLGSSATP